MLPAMFLLTPWCLLLACVNVQLGESLEEQLGQRLLRMPPPPQLPPRVRQGQQHTIEQQQQPSMFQLPYELPPVLADPMQVSELEGCSGSAQQHGTGHTGCEDGHRRLSWSASCALLVQGTFQS